MRRPASKPPDLPGYEFIRLLGSGGFSDVFLYEQRLPRRKVAVKVLLTESVTPQTRKQFADEANLMASLSAHPNIVTIFHADVSKDGRPFFVMEYCSGPSLAARYKAQPLEIEEALRLGVRLSGAVATAHAAGILHRDIKPANVLVNEYGAPALTDFGISTATGDDLGLTTTSRDFADVAATSGSSVGMSVPWSPPEVFGDDPVPDVRSDIFSLAATIYTLLAGHTPFERPGGSNSQLDLASRIQRGEMTPLKREDVPAALRGVLLKGMDPLPERRYARATDFARALQAVEIELGYQATTLEIPSSLVARPQAAGASGAEETRVRGVVTVVAQPAPGLVPEPVAPTFVEPPTKETVKAGGTEILDSTVVRVTGPTVPAPHPNVALPRRSRVPFVVGGVVAFVVGVAIVTIIVVPKPDTYVPVQGDSSVSGDGDTNNELPGGIVVPTPKISEPERSENGESVTFSWTNPDPVDGDAYLWRRTDGGQEGPANPTGEESALITGLAPGDEVCVSVWLNRDGQLSADPAEACA